MAKQTVLSDSVINAGHIGIAIYDPQKDKYLYNHNSEKYFTPASNIKLFSWYAGLKYLGDSLVGLRYRVNNDGELNIIGTADPTFLHPDFISQPVFHFLKKWKKINYPLSNYSVKFEPWGNGWQLDDYLGDYSAEKSEFPIYGNLATFYMQADTIAVVPKAFFNSSILWKNETLKNGAKPFFDIVRPFDKNTFHTLFRNSSYLTQSNFTSQKVPFKTHTGNPEIVKNKTFIHLLEDTLHQSIGTWAFLHQMPKFTDVIHSQSSDSFFRYMMHRSDNLFAEQTLLMACDKYLGYMSEKALIDTMLKTILKDIPQKPQWVDGSGLSRYNLFTPKSFVWLLNKIKNEFPWQRIIHVLPTGGEGTLRNYYLNDSTFVYAKTGTLSNNCALSGYLITRKNKLLIFSILVNNYPTGATPVRRAVEIFLKQVRQNF